MLALSVGLSFVHPWGNARSVSADGSILNGSSVPENVREILETKCADCHSNKTHWPVYSRLAPGSWLMEHDVQAGRNAMNLSDWEEMGAGEQIAALTRIAAEVRSGEMPPKAYGFAHPAKRLSADERQILGTWTRTERKRIRTIDEQRKGTSKQ